MPSNREDLVFLKKNFPNKLYFFYIKLTNRCNLNCSICSQTADSKKEIGISLNEIEQGIQKVISDVVELAFSGGEPFVRYDDLVYLFQKYSIQVPGKTSIFTNGTISIKDFNHFINSKGEKAFFRISIDGIEKDHDEIRGKGRYQQTINFINELEKHKFPFMIQSVLDESYLENDGEKLINFYNSFKNYKFLTRHDCTPPRICGRFATQEHYEHYLKNVERYLEIFAKYDINHHICGYCPLREEKHIDVYNEICLDEFGYITPICLTGHDNFFPYNEYSYEKYFQYLNNYKNIIDMSKIPKYICPLKFNDKGMTLQ
ncbi:MAG: radical SAM protein [Bacilli bacterium]|nr:radical SAM protein [Bacilli bacterium]